MSAKKLALVVIGLSLLPNLPFLVLNITFSWDRTGVILAYFILTFFALIDFRLPRLNQIYRVAAIALFVLVMLFDILSFVMRFFALRFSELLFASPAMFELDFLAFLPYIAVFLGFLFTILLFVFLLARTKRVPFRYAGVMVVVFGAVFTFDVAANFQANYKIEAGDSLIRWFSGVEQTFVFESAARKSRFETTVEGDNHVLFVIVEALGVFQDEALNKRLLAPLQTPALRRKYQIETGTINYLGSTTAAELREFCQTRNSYAQFMSDKIGYVEHCLPARMKSAGFRTVALHGFVGNFFGRHVWYPKIGFEEIIARDELLKRAGRVPIGFCGGTFKGVCDKHVADEIEAILAVARKKHFIYWLTLNSHPPSRRAPGFGRPFPCSNFPRMDAQSCVMAEYWMEVFEAVARFAQAENRRPIDIVIVGDHAPPLLTRVSRANYQIGKVPYLTLRNKK